MSDDDRSGHFLKWGNSPACPKNLEAAVLAAAGQSPPGAPGVPQKFSGKEPGETCLYVIVTDDEGAQGFASKPITIKARDVVIEGPATVKALAEATFTATFRDQPDAVGRAKFSWASAAGLTACESAKTAAEGKERGGDRATWSSRTPRRPFCVAVAVLDEFNAASTATLAVTEVLGAEPVIRMVLPTPETREVGLFASVHLSALDVQDDSSIATTQKYAWSVTGPKGPILPADLACETGTEPYEVCFEAGAIGKYAVTLSVTEEGRTAAAAPMELSVDDRPPCIRVTEPSYLTSERLHNDYDKPRPFMVTAVQDDADPVPRMNRANLGQFSWSVRKITPEKPSFARRTDAIYPYFTVPAFEHQPGDEIEVRVEYRDRVDRARLPGFAERCKPDDLRCELVAGSQCYQWVTWRVVYL